MDVVWPRMKSSADSISILPVVDGRDPVAIRPSGSPVLKKNAVPAAGPAANVPASNSADSAAVDMLLIISVPFEKGEI